MPKKVVIYPIPETTWSLISEAPSDDYPGGRMITQGIPATSITIVEVE